MSNGYNKNCNQDFRGKHCERKDCNLECLTHKGNAYSIWNTVGKYLKCNKKMFISQGIQLAELREKYEYSAELCDINELKNAKKYFENIKNVIEKLGYIK